MTEIRPKALSCLFCLRVAVWRRARCFELGNQQGEGYLCLESNWKTRDAVAYIGVIPYPCQQTDNKTFKARLFP